MSGIYVLQFLRTFVPVNESKVNAQENVIFLILPALFLNASEKLVYHEVQAIFLSNIGGILILKSSLLLPVLYLFLSSRNFSLFTSSMTRLYVWPLRRETILHHLSTASHQPDPSLQSPLMNRIPISPPYSPVLRALEGSAGTYTPPQALSVRP